MFARALSAKVHPITASSKPLQLVAIPRLGFFIHPNPNRPPEVRLDEVWRQYGGSMDLHGRAGRAPVPLWNSPCLDRICLSQCASVRVREVR